MSTNAASMPDKTILLASTTSSWLGSSIWSKWAWNRSNESRAAFQTCFTGDGGGTRFGCEAFDFDADNDVDVVDHKRFLVTFVGPSVLE